MNALVIDNAEKRQIDNDLAQVMVWAKTRQAEAEQLSLDAARLLSCSGERMERIQKQGFFRRCWSRFTGETARAEQATTGDLIKVQKYAFRYLNLLQEQNILMAHSMLTLKNNLCSLAIAEEETRNLIGKLAQRTLERFIQLENRVDQLETNTNLIGWLITLDEQDYPNRIPTEYMRLLRIINEFYSIKNDNWNYRDLTFMKKAIRIVGIDPNKRVSVRDLISSLVDEIQDARVGFAQYGMVLQQNAPVSLENYSQYAISNISSPVFTTIHGLYYKYNDQLDVIETLQDNLNISTSEALKNTLWNQISKMNVDLNYKFTLAETAIEILSCIRLCEKLANTNEQDMDFSGQEEVQKDDESPSMSDEPPEWAVLFAEKLNELSRNSQS